jgi:hypothetical protein
MTQTTTTVGTSNFILQDFILQHNNY